MIVVGNKNIVNVDVIYVANSTSYVIRRSSFGVVFLFVYVVMSDVYVVMMFVVVSIGVSVLFGVFVYVCSVYVLMFSYAIKKFKK